MEKTIAYYHSAETPQNHALQFDGIDDYLEIPEIAAIRTQQNEPLTIDFWMWIPSYPSQWQKILSKWGAGGGHDDEYVFSLRQCDADIVSLVAVQDEKIVGHILFSPISLEGDASKGGMATRSLAMQSEAGLEELKKRNSPLLIVLGHPEYYPKFGFEPASRFGLQCQWEVPDEDFMALLLDPGLPVPINAVAKYHSEFDIAM
jgi:putative acetyltransferase